MEKHQQRGLAVTALVGMIKSSCRKIDVRLADGDDRVNGPDESVQAVLDQNLIPVLDQTVRFLVIVFVPVDGGSTTDGNMGGNSLLHSLPSLLLGGVIGHLKATVGVRVFHGGEAPADGLSLLSHDHACPPPSTKLEA
jgi:hypothetical protein